MRLLCLQRYYYLIGYIIDWLSHMWFSAYAWRANSVQRMFFFPYERNRSRNTKNAERAKQPLLLLMSAILNHNCPALLVRYIHRQKAPVSPPSLCPPFLSSSLIPFAVLSLPCAIAVPLLLLSGIPSLAFPLFHSCSRSLSSLRG